ncbi:putative quinone oxidoreductase [Aulographum hederae CBS 113979]|uniref:Putative quinone oxidoreductase n=1 Tax=Aulographum hederae CBS 113979 TaxID=1176131 RepID=A0A6G1GUL1_9PEZI|nr:putative quinone oxidoreductase [Aulographum hederae CBS 113979]
MPETMRAVDIQGKTGPATSLHITDIPKPVPAAAQVLVKVKCFGLNRMDLLQREGLYPLPPQAGPILGVEFSGTIESLGSPQEEGFKIGDQVFGLAYGGAYAEYIAVYTKMVVHKPSHFSWEEAAGIPETWITALQAIYVIGEFTPGKSILWHAGASSVSIAGIQLSAADSASKVLATARQDSKCAFVVDELGATAAFNTTSSNWSEEVLKATDGKGVDIIVDYLGASYFQGNLDAVAKDGRIVHLGCMGGTKLPEGVDISGFIKKRIRFEGSSLRSRDMEYQGKLRDQLVQHALPKFEKGEYKIFVEKVFPWEQVAEAHQLMESNKVKGKIICRIS